MGIQSFPVDAIAGAEESEKSQESPKCSSPCGHRLIVGFELKATPDRENGVVSGRGSLSTRSCRPTSGLEILLSAPRTHGSEHPPWGTDSRRKPPAEDASRKDDGDSLTPAIAARFPDQDPPRLDRQQKEFCPFSGISCRQSHSIPIAHSPSPCIAKSSSRTSARDGSHLAKASLRCTERGDDEGERGVFSLLAVSPGTGDGAEELSCCTMDFMEACFLCKRRLGDGRDIFMYRGDKAFCSVECRHHQIVIDEQVELGKKYFSAVQKRGASSVQSRRSHHRTTRLLAVSTAAAA